MKPLPHPPAIGILPLLAVGTICASFAAALYILLQPTVLPNPGMAAYKAPPGVLLYSGAGTASQIGVMSASLDGGAVADDPLSGETAVKDLPPKPAAVTAQATQPTKSKESSRPKKSQRIVARARDDRSRTVMTFQPDYSTFGRWWN